jgi:hypothetical protein
VRAQYVTSGYADHYDALKITVLNRTEGPVDTLTLKLKDVLGSKPVPRNPNFPNGVSPHIWTNDGKSEWYAYQPTQADLKLVSLYLDVFRALDRTISNRTGSKKSSKAPPRRDHEER